jgi:hypothetical protein
VSGDLAAFVAAELGASAPDAVVALARHLAADEPLVEAVLYYGSTLRTGDLDGVLDFYVLTSGPHRRALRGLANWLLPPEVSYREIEIGGRTYRNKIATMTLAQFEAATTAGALDTTVWTRFVQPAGLVWSGSGEAGEAVRRAVARAVQTAAGFAFALGPAQGAAGDYWQALFRQTYAAEFRVEPSGREASILAFAPARWTELLPLAWAAAGIAFDRAGETLRPKAKGERDRLKRQWSVKRLLGKPLNIARILKASATFDGASRYAVWKIERHTGVKIALTPWRERHPFLASPIVVWSLWKARR